MKINIKNTWTVIFLCLTINSFAQKTHEVIYGDKNFMRLSSNNLNYEFKDSLEDGIWVAYYDSTMKDSACLATIVGGQLNGIYSLWDKKDKYVYESGILKNGVRNGIIHFRLLNDDGKMYLNIERWKNGAFDGYLQQEW